MRIKTIFPRQEKSDIESYKLDEAYIETQTNHQIKVSWSDQGGEFLSEAMIKHQNQKGTVRAYRT